MLKKEKERVMKEKETIAQVESSSSEEDDNEDSMDEDDFLESDDVLINLTVGASIDDSNPKEQQKMNDQKSESVSSDRDGSVKVKDNDDDAKTSLGDDMKLEQGNNKAYDLDDLQSLHEMQEAKSREKDELKIAPLEELRILEEHHKRSIRKNVALHEKLQELTKNDGTTEEKENIQHEIEITKQSIATWSVAIVDAARLVKKLMGKESSKLKEVIESSMKKQEKLEDEQSIAQSNVNENSEKLKEARENIASVEANVKRRQKELEEQNMNFKLVKIEHDLLMEERKALEAEAKKLGKAELKSDEEKDHAEERKKSIQTKLSSVAKWIQKILKTQNEIEKSKRKLEARLQYAETDLNELKEGEADALLQLENSTSTADKLRMQKIEADWTIFETQIKDFTLEIEQVVADVKNKNTSFRSEVIEKNILIRNKAHEEQIQKLDKELEDIGIALKNFKKQAIGIQKVLEKSTENQKRYFSSSKKVIDILKKLDAEGKEQAEVKQKEMKIEVDTVREQSKKCEQSATEKEVNILGHIEVEKRIQIAKAKSNIDRMMIAEARGAVQKEFHVEEWHLHASTLGFELFDFYSRQGLLMKAQEIILRLCKDGDKVRLHRKALMHCSDTRNEAMFALVDLYRVDKKDEKADRVVKIGKILYESIQARKDARKREHSILNMIADLPDHIATAVKDLDDKEYRVWVTLEATQAKAFKYLPNELHEYAEDTVRQRLKEINKAQKELAMAHADMFASLEPKYSYRIIDAYSEYHKALTSVERAHDNKSIAVSQNFDEAIRKTKNELSRFNESLREASRQFFLDKQDGEGELHPDTAHGLEKCSYLLTRAEEGMEHAYNFAQQWLLKAHFLAHKPVLETQRILERVQSETYFELCGCLQGAEQVTKKKIFELQQSYTRSLYELVHEEIEHKRTIQEELKKLYNNEIGETLHKIHKTVQKFLSTMKSQNDRMQRKLDKKYKDLEISIAEVFEVAFCASMLELGKDGMIVSRADHPEIIFDEAKDPNSDNARNKLLSLLKQLLDDESNNKDEAIDAGDGGTDIDDQLSKDAEEEQKPVENSTQKLPLLPLEQSFDEVIDLAERIRMDMDERLGKTSTQKRTIQCNRLFQDLTKAIRGYLDDASRLPNHPHPDGAQVAAASLENFEKSNKQLQVITIGSIRVKDNYFSFIDYRHWIATQIGRSNALHKFEEFVDYMTAEHQVQDTEKQHSQEDILAVIETEKKIFFQLCEDVKNTLLEEIRLQTSRVIAMETKERLNLENHLKIALSTSSIALILADVSMNTKERLRERFYQASEVERRTEYTFLGIYDEIQKALDHFIHSNFSEVEDKVDHATQHLDNLEEDLIMRFPTEVVDEYKTARQDFIKVKRTLMIIQEESKNELRKAYDKVWIPGLKSLRQEMIISENLRVKIEASELEMVEQRRRIEEARNKLSSMKGNLTQTFEAVWSSHDLDRETTTTVASNETHESGVGPGPIEMSKEEGDDLRVKAQEEVQSTVDSINKQKAKYRSAEQQEKSKQKEFLEFMKKEEAEEMKKMEASQEVESLERNLELLHLDMEQFEREIQSKKQDLLLTAMDESGRKDREKIEAQIEELSTQLEEHRAKSESIGAERQKAIEREEKATNDADEARNKAKLAKQAFEKASKDKIIAQEIEKDSKTKLAKVQIESKFASIKSKLLCAYDTIKNIGKAALVIKGFGESKEGLDKLTEVFKKQEGELVQASKAFQDTERKCDNCKFALSTIQKNLEIAEANRQAASGEHEELEAEEHIQELTESLKKTEKQLAQLKMLKEKQQKVFMGIEEKTTNFFQSCDNVTEGINKVGMQFQAKKMAAINKVLRSAKTMKTDKALRLKNKKKKRRLERKEIKNKRIAEARQKEAAHLVELEKKLEVMKKSRQEMSSALQANGAEIASLESQKFKMEKSAGNISKSTRNMIQKMAGIRRNNALRLLKIASCEKKRSLLEENWAKIFKVASIKWPVYLDWVEKQYQWLQVSHEEAFRIVDGAPQQSVILDTIKKGKKRKVELTARLTEAERELRRVRLN
eukprot:g2364.t1